LAAATAGGTGFKAARRAAGAAACAGATGLARLERDVLLAAERGLFERHLERVAQVAPLCTPLARRPAEDLAEQPAKQVLHARERKAARKRVARAIGAEAIVARPLVGVGQDGVGGRHFLA